MVAKQNIIIIVCLLSLFLQGAEMKGESLLVYVPDGHAHLGCENAPAPAGTLSLFQTLLSFAMQITG